MTTITLPLDDERAEALAQLLKRLGWTAIREHSYDEAEAYRASDALDVLRAELAQAGFNPR